MNEHDMRILAHTLHHERLEEARRHHLARTVRSAEGLTTARTTEQAARRGRRSGLSVLLGRSA